MELIFVGLGLLVGFLVGLTGGVGGGGALMTPSLIFLGVEPLTAVGGTDLLYATITRIFGIFFQGRKGKIRHDIASSS
ncbi:TSUP family transporter [Thermococcus peptonophilus]|uniref:TSUP family transporter n=1 Tax=Thermococcus peptonophilus TaxID=53952 RepID=UPI000A4D11B1